MWPSVVRRVTFLIDVREEAADTWMTGLKVKPDAMVKLYSGEGGTEPPAINL